MNKGYGKMKNNYNKKEYFKKMDRYFDAVNYLSVAQLYLLKNPLMRKQLSKDDIKKKIVGHWGTCAGQNFVYTHLNRIIKKYDLDMILISGPGHGGNFFLANSYLEGTYSKYYPEISQDEQGMTKFCKQFSFAKGVSSHVAPQIPGSIHEGGELGYSLSHGYGSVLDNPNLITAVIVGDGEAETGPIANSWLLNKFINPKTDGAVLPILHLNGYKISNPTIYSRLDRRDLVKIFKGFGYQPIFVEGEEKEKMHKKMARALDRCITKIKQIQSQARKGQTRENICYPMIILRTPKGWTGPKFVDGKKMEGSFRSHQVPIPMDKPEHFNQLKEWLESYKPESLFDDNYRLKEDILQTLPGDEKKISASDFANGGLKLKELILPDLKEFEFKFDKIGTKKAQDMVELGKYLSKVFKLNEENKNFRLFSPDEAMSNRLYHIFDHENRDFNTKIYNDDEYLSKDGRIMDSYLSEHACEGELEGYLLTGRHGMFVSYEAFARVVDSMVSQHAKWLKVTRALEWRKPISSLNIVLTSNVWQQDHNGYTHQEPGFMDFIANKKREIVSIYLPPDANSLLACAKKSQQSFNKINVIIASKHPSLQWLSMDKAVENLEKGIAVWKEICLNDYKNPDIVIACAGDSATLEGVACVSLIKQYLPKLNVRFVNVIDLMKLENGENSLSDGEFDQIFTKDKPVIFNFHGYARFIYGLIAKRKNKNFSVHGYKEEGTITTPFDMRVQNEIDRFHLLIDVIDKLGLKSKEKKLLSVIEEKLEKHNAFIAEFGVDMPEITDFSWKN